MPTKLLKESPRELFLITKNQFDWANRDIPGIVIKRIAPVIKK